MFGLEYIMALVKVFFQVAFAIVTAIPFYYSWNCIAPVYFDFIPVVYHNLPYWHIVAAMLVFTYVGEQIGKVTPKLVSVTQNNTGND